MAAYGDLGSLPGQVQWTPSRVAGAGVAVDHLGEGYLPFGGLPAHLTACPPGGALDGIDAIVDVTNAGTTDQEAALLPGAAARVDGPTFATWLDSGDAAELPT